MIKGPVPERISKLFFKSRPCSFQIIAVSLKYLQEFFETDFSIRIDREIPLRGKLSAIQYFYCRCSFINMYRNFFKAVFP